MERYFKIRKNETKNNKTFIDYISKIPGISVIDVTVSDCVKKKIIHEYPNKQGFIDLSYYFDEVNIYENRTISLQVNVIGEGITEIERENNAYEKINQLSQYILDRTDNIDISIAKYGEYFFTGVPTNINIEDKKDQDVLGLLKVTYEFLVEPEAKKMIDGYFPLSIFEADGVGSFLSTCGYPYRRVYFYLKKKKPITVYRYCTEADFSKKIKIIVDINGKIKKEISNSNIEINRKKGLFSFSINSTDLNGGENYIQFEGQSSPELSEKKDYYLIIENNRI